MLDLPITGCPRPADAYHTLYCLSGLSAAQRLFVPSRERRSELVNAWDSESKAGQGMSRAL